MNLLLPMMVAALLVCGMGVALLGSLKVPLARRLQIDEARVGGLVSLFGLILIPVILGAGFLTDQAGQGTETIGKQTVLQAGSVLFAFSLGLLAWARHYGMALAAVVLLSASWAIMINVGNVLIQPAFGGSDAFAQNLGNVFFGLGAFLTPLACGVLVQRASFSLAVALLAGVALLPALLAIPVDVTALTAAASGTPGGAIPGLDVILANPIFWMCAIAMFFYGPLEASMAAWTTTFLMERGVAEGSATRCLSAFWLAFLSARLLTALTLPMLPAGSEKPLVLALALVCVIVLGRMVFTRTTDESMMLVVIAGLVFGPLFPTLMAIMQGSIPNGARGRAVGFYFAIGGIGWTTIPMLIGAYARTHGIQRGFRIAAAAAGCLAIVALILFLSPV